MPQHKYLVALIVSLITQNHVQAQIFDALNSNVGSNKKIEWTTSGYGNGYGHKIYNYDVGGKTLLNFAHRNNSSTWTDFLTLTSYGLVGIGTTDPTSKFHVVGDTHLNGSTQLSGIVTSTSNPALLISSDAIEANLVIQSTGTRSMDKGAALGFVLPANTNGGNYWQQGRIIVTPDNASNANAHGRMYLQTRYYNGAWNWRNNLVLLPNGYVGVGTDTPTSPLSVAGTMDAREIKVEVEAGSTPDYVFADHYQLTTLEETASYIEENHHLPEIPSAKEMEANGMNVGEMNLLLLKKIEELTLHLIEVKATVNKSEELNAILLNRVKKLEKDLQ